MNEQHTDPNEKYNAEVRRIAEVINSNSGGDILHIPFLEKAAHVMVAEMAKQYEYAYFSNYHGDEDSDDYALWNQNCISEMIERGLIPAPENK